MSKILALELAFMETLYIKKIEKCALRKHF